MNQHAPRDRDLPPVKLRENNSVNQCDVSDASRDTDVVLITAARVCPPLFGASSWPISRSLARHSPQLGPTDRSDTTLMRSSPGDRIRIPRISTL